MTVQSSQTAYTSREFRLRDNEVKEYLKHNNMEFKVERTFFCFLFGAPAAMHVAITCGSRLGNDSNK
jgi:hypothetical protein